MTHEPARPGRGRLAFASAAGTALEYYDFALYNSLAALVFNRLFFPSFDPVSGTILSFATFWVGYLARPLGGVLFGRLGDLRGRRFVLVITLLMMGAATTAIGLLPTYSQIGVLAPILLVTLRFVQGVALGGEWAGAVLLSAEHGEDRARGRNASFAQMGPAIGVLMSYGAMALTTALVSEQQLTAWAWRVPLLVSAVLVAFGLWVRAGVPETPQFRALQTDLEPTRAPLGEVVRGHWRGLLLAGGSRFGPDVMYSLISAFALTYLTTVLGLSKTLGTGAIALGCVFSAIFIYVAGTLSDRFGRRRIYGIGVAAAALWLLVLFPALESRASVLIVAIVVLGLIVHAFMYGPQAAFIAEQFPTRVRYAGSSLAYTFAGVFAGGIAPLAMTALYARFDTTLGVVIYVFAALAITAVALCLARPPRPG